MPDGRAAAQATYWLRNAVNCSFSSGGRLWTYFCGNRTVGQSSRNAPKEDKFFGRITGRFAWTSRSNLWRRRARHGGLNSLRRCKARRWRLSGS